MTGYSQGSPCDQRLHVVGVDLQGLVVLVHGFHVTAVLEVVHAGAHTDNTSDTQFFYPAKCYFFLSVSVSIITVCIVVFGLWFDNLYFFWKFL